MAFTWNSTGHIRCHHQAYREADVDGEGFAQGVSTEDGLSDGAAAKQLTNREEHVINQTEIKQSNQLKELQELLKRADAMFDFWEKKLFHPKRKEYLQPRQTFRGILPEIP